MELNAAKEAISYAEGYRLGEQLQAATEQINPSDFVQGLQDAVAGQAGAVSAETVQQAVEVLQKAEEAKKAEGAAEKIADIEALLAEELTTTESGLKYKILSEGEGTAPVAESTVECHYEGWLTDGTKFDSSVDRGQPASFPLNRVIPGWTEGLQLMQPGAKYAFVIPSDLGYGEAGSPGAIPGNATLVFEVELLSVQ